MTRENYTTERFLSDSPTADTLLLKAIPVENDRLLRCEAASPALVSFCSERGIKLANSVYAEQATKLLEIALFDVIKPLPFLWAAVSQLVWCCHVVLGQDDDYDISLHGLYVFYVLRWMWRQISQTTHRSIDRDFALRRILDIKEEIDAVRALEDSPALTGAGKRFLQELFVSR